LIFFCNFRWVFWWFFFKFRYYNIWRISWRSVFIWISSRWFFLTKLRSCYLLFNSYILIFYLLIFCFFISYFIRFRWMLIWWLIIFWFRWWRTTLWFLNCHKSLVMIYYFRRYWWFSYILFQYFWTSFLTNR